MNGYDWISLWIWLIWRISALISKRICYNNKFFQKPKKISDISVYIRNIQSISVHIFRISVWSKFLDGYEHLEHIWFVLWYHRWQGHDFPPVIGYDITGIWYHKSLMAALWYHIWCRTWYWLWYHRPMISLVIDIIASEAWHHRFRTMIPYMILDMILAMIS